MLIMLLALFLVTMFLGTPIAFSMSFASIVTNLTHGASSLMLTAQQCYDSTSNLSLLAVPFFMLAGSIMNMGGISRRLINFCRLFVGRIRGGLAIVAVLAAMIFAAISGSGPATVAALGVFMIPAMVNDGYDVGFAGALMGSAGGLGIIIPPSIPMVIYATLAGCSVGTMFCAGIVPGIILGLAMMIYAYIIARRNGYKPAPVDAPTFKDKAKVFADGLPAIAMPVIILGGIYSGIFTPTQASGIAVIYGLILGVLVYKEIKFKDIVKMFIESGITAASAMLIVSLADGFNWIITTNRVPKMLSDWFLGIFSSAAGILIALIILLTIIGCFMSVNAAMIVLTPILVPVMRSFNVSPITLGIIMIICVSLGMVTPPFGVNLFVAAGIAKVPFDCMTKHAFILVGLCLAVLLVMVFVPGIITFLPFAAGNVAIKGAGLYGAHKGNAYSGTGTPDGGPKRADGGKRPSCDGVPWKRRDGVSGGCEIHDRPGDPLRAYVFHDGAGGTAHCPAGACRCRLPCPTEDLSGRGPCGYHTGYGGRNLP